jgi:thiazole synthase
LELGADAVLINTAIATAENPVLMASAFRLGVEAGRAAYEARGPRSSGATCAQATSPLTAFLDNSTV